MKEAQPKTTHLKEYEVPPFLIEETELRVELDEEQTHVKTSLKMKRNPAADFHHRTDLNSCFS